ncbi:MAG: glycohydrolase toxin TNT-related protein [Acetobacteraceae bacterium]|nr:glycohydrolase toxin TNT-related protein [Acetobacteraceae bacterium]MBV8591336.1 glycohydrolase toxin TNT-related protein [Acetobacteraceae bacterium]
MQPLPVQAGPAAPWFDEPGGVEQYETKESAQQLRQEGVIAPEPQ